MLKRTALCPYTKDITSFSPCCSVLPPCISVLLIIHVHDGSVAPKNHQPTTKLQLTDITTERVPKLIALAKAVFVQLFVFGKSP